MFSPHAPRAVLAASAAVLALLLTGCSQPDGGKAGGPGADPDAGKEPAIGAVPALLESRSLVFPLAPYSADDRQIAVLDEAQDVLIDQCMQRYGFRYQQRRRADAAARQDENRRYGLSDPAEAARSGYTNPRSGGPAKSQQQSLGPNEKLVLNGLEVDPSLPVPMSQEEAEKSDVATTVVGGQKVPAGGCLRESSLKLFTPTKGTVDGMVAQGYGLEAYGRAQKDSRVVAATKAWSECMAQHGYAGFKDPTGPPPGIDESALGSPQAITMAGQDVACKKETNLVGVWYTVEVAYQQRAIERNAETLDLAKKQLDERMKLAATLQASGA
ncbi:hypothetical protein ACFV9E_15740 [Streptomyces sp. NPDC059835]|uniref:hypothetical protein n=1 Tax=Streptomyces sp. NPDC059835 TaxID=3346967 RepID=UPI00365992E8